eukprot:4706352-Amphidinium_carterae.1
MFASVRVKRDQIVESSRASQMTGTVLSVDGLLFEGFFAGTLRHHDIDVEQCIFYENVSRTSSKKITDVTEATFMQQMLNTLSSLKKEQRLTVAKMKDLCHQCQEGSGFDHYTFVTGGTEKLS